MRAPCTTHSASLCPSLSHSLSLGRLTCCCTWPHCSLLARHSSLLAYEKFVSCALSSWHCIQILINAVTPPLPLHPFSLVLCPFSLVLWLFYSFWCDLKLILTARNSESRQQLQLSAMQIPICIRQSSRLCRQLNVQLAWTQPRAWIRSRVRH